jgi:hypothetical protein
MSHLDELNSVNAQERMRAAITLGYEQPSGAARVLVERLSVEAHVGAAAACCAALEMIGDRSIVPELILVLDRCPDSQVWDVCHAIGRLTGIEPIVDLRADREERRRTWLEALRAKRSASVTTIPPDGEFVRVAVDLGSGRIRVDYDPPPSATTQWVRWDRSLFVGAKPLYSVGSTCGTCELILKLAGWPAERAVVLSKELADSVADSVKPSATWVAQWSPILAELQTGHYLVAAVDMPIERVDQPSRSWMSLRGASRTEEDLESATGVDWTGAPHYQGPSFDGSPPTYWMILPSEDLSALDEVRVEHFMREITNGRKPTIVAVAWLDDREVHAEWAERFNVLCVLDGHHKLEAYSRLAVPANVICLFHLENSWGPPEDRARPVVDTLAQLNRAPGAPSYFPVH